MQQRVSALESEYATDDLWALLMKLMRKKLQVLRNTESECSDTDRDKSDRSTRLNEIGEALTDINQAEDAIPVLLRCTALDTDYAPCFASLGRAFHVLGRESEAISAFKRTIEIGGFSERNAEAIEYARPRLSGKSLGMILQVI
jgi:tetratricopeptide (TPR) repeat protein